MRTMLPLGKNFVRLIAAIALTLCSEVGVSQGCTSDEQIAKGLERLQSLQKEYSDRSMEYLQTLRKKAVALDAYHACRKKNNKLDEMFSALTLQGDPCSKEILDFNSLEEAGEGQKQIIDVTLTQMDTLGILLRSAQSSRCRRP